MPENFKKEELAIDMAKANLVALFFFVFFAILFGIPYFLLWAETNAMESYKSFTLNLGVSKSLIILAVILLGIIAHELIHGVTWALFAKAGFKSISFGVMWKYLSPYCHCSEPLLVKHYLIGGLMPGIVLGIIPLLLALATGDIQWLLFGITFSVAATGDFMMAIMLRKERMTNLVQDHPSKVGCYIYRPLSS